MARYLCDQFNELTKECVQWSEYTPLIPELTKEQIISVWGSFLIALLVSWGFKKIIHLFGVW